MKAGLITTFVILVILCTCSSCKVTKQIQKTDTETQTESKSDSASTVQNDIEKESKTLTEVTEIIDSVVFITPKGELISDTTGHKGKLIPVPIKKKKITKTNQETKETDKTKSKTALKKSDENHVDTKVITKDIKKTGIPWYWFLIAALIIIAAYLAWSFVRVRF